MEEQFIKVKSNGLGTAGFIISIIGSVFCWVPLLGILSLFIGLFFSTIGLLFGILGRKPIGKSIAGIIVSALFIVVSFLVVGGIFFLA